MSSFVHPSGFPLTKKKPQHPMMMPLSAEVDVILLLPQMLLMITKQASAECAKAIPSL